MGSMTSTFHARSLGSTILLLNKRTFHGKHRTCSGYARLCSCPHHMNGITDCLLLHRSTVYRTGIVFILAQLPQYRTGFRGLDHAALFRADCRTSALCCGFRPRALMLAQADLVQDLDPFPPHFLRFSVSPFLPARFRRCHCHRPPLRDPWRAARRTVLISAGFTHFSTRSLTARVAVSNLVALGLQVLVAGSAAPASPAAMMALCGYRPHRPHACACWILVLPRRPPPIQCPLLAIPPPWVSNAAYGTFCPGRTLKGADEGRGIASRSVRAQAWGWACGWAAN